MTLERFSKATKSLRCHQHQHLISSFQANRGKKVLIILRSTNYPRYLNYKYRKLFYFSLLLCPLGSLPSFSALQQKDPSWKKSLGDFTAFLVEFTFLIPIYYCAKFHDVCWLQNPGQCIKNNPGWAGFWISEESNYDPEGMWSGRQAVPCQTTIS